jgi:hypothetical protein
MSLALETSMAEKNVAHAPNSFPNKGEKRGGTPSFLTIM